MTYSSLCSQLLLHSQLALTARNWWEYDVLLSLIAILFTLSPQARSTNVIGALLGTKMLRERIDGADVEPPKAIRSFILYHHMMMRLRTMIVETCCKRHARVGISSGIAAILHRQVSRYPPKKKF